MMMRRRRPLMRAAMVGGVGYMAGKSGARSAARESEQDQRLAELEAQPAPTAAPPPPPPAPPPAPPAPVAPPAAAPAATGGDLVSQLQELKTLMDEGVLTPEEFEAAKQQVLAG
jgi:hypothetical protein